MNFECYRVVVPEDARLTGYTVAGQRVWIAPGEYVVHRMRPKVPLRGISEALRFLGADERGQDVHIAMSSDADVEHVLQLAESSDGSKQVGYANEPSTPRPRPWAITVPRSTPSERTGYDPQSHQVRHRVPERRRAGV